METFAAACLDYRGASGTLVVWPRLGRTTPGGGSAMLDFDRYSHLTFDCYGTLIDWERGILAALRPLLNRHGVAPTDDQVLELYGELESAAEAGPYQPYRAVLAAVVDGFGARLGFAPSPEERASFAASVGDWPPFPDTVEALRSLARRFRLVIL